MAIAIIGAGMAGLAAARRLVEAGRETVVFDKSRGLGGRMATRRIDGMSFDHGAQYFTARGPAFRAALDQWCAEGSAAKWFDDAFVGSPGMSAPARSLAAGLTIVTSCQITDLHRAHDGWTVLDANGPVAIPRNGAFDAVVLALPAPQALPLAAGADLRFEPMEQASYAPCWALMLAFAEPTDLPDRQRPDHGAVAWLARNASKPGRADAPETWVLHASPEWSRAHLECTADEVAPKLLASFRAATGVDAPPLYVAAHRWRYALVEQAAGTTCLWDSQARLGACGDWCLGPRVEAAFDSGAGMADVLLKS